MKQTILLLILFSVLFAFCNEPPVVENITLEQRDDGSYIVDIYYDLYDADGDSMYVSILASDNEGETWNYPIDSIEGDFGEDQISGNSKHIIWDYAIDHPQVIDIPVMIKIFADDRNIDFGWALVLEGEYAFGETHIIQNMDYSYEIMVNKVTNEQFMNYLQSAYEEGIVEVNDDGVTGNYAGDLYYSEGNYNFYDFTGMGKIYFSGNRFYIEEGFDNFPATEMSWFGANAFCEFYDMRLPTEEEWEKAARATNAWYFPWGNELTGQRANYENSGDPWDNDITPAGFYNGQNYNGFQTIDSPSPYGCYDMCGNVYDWTSSWYDPGRRIQKGGAYNCAQNNGVLNPGHTMRNESYLMYYSVGFRCVRDID